MKKPVVFSLVHEQSVFMTIIMSLLTFLSVLALGICLSIGTGVMRWNNQWELFATVQITNHDKQDTIKQILATHADKIDTVTEISDAQMNELMSPWISDGGVLQNYLPKMWELKFKNQSDMDTVGAEISKVAKFLTHATALKPSTDAGWYMIMMTALILMMTMSAIGICISYIARNTAMLHRRELEILNQIGASDNFVARQMQVIVGRICIIACGIGFICAAPILLLMLSAAHSTRVGLMAMMGLSGPGWLTLVALPIAIIIFAIWVTRRTTIKILNN
ncbi:MAG: hypothetical protein IKL37_04425 [Alphaproteobacteria bacterium]|nr:hypothetical protein [Alphaproteobacteria bacterium]